MTKIGMKEERRNNAITAREWGITTVTTVMHWTRINTTNHHGTKTETTRKGHNWVTPRNDGMGART